MDILKRYAIPFKGLSEGKHEYGFELDDEFFRTFENAEMPGGKGTVKVGLNKTATLMELDFIVNAEVSVMCDRCMEEFALPVDYAGGFKVRFGEEKEDFDGDIMWLGHRESEVNIAQYVYESIVLSMPYRKVHPDTADGKPGCDPDTMARVKLISEDELEKAEKGSEMQKMADNPEWQKLKDIEL